MLSYVFRKKLKKYWIIIRRGAAISILICLVLHIIFCIKSFSEYKLAIDNLTINEIDLTNISDGEYKGTADVGYIYATVNVTVKNGEIKKIELLEHGNERGDKAAIIVDRIVKNQSIKVDGITSATNSSNVIMKAVENAFEDEQ